MPQRASQRKFGKSQKLHLAKQKKQKLEGTRSKEKSVYRKRTFVLKKREEKASRSTRKSCRYVSGCVCKALSTIVCVCCNNWLQVNRLSHQTKRATARLSRTRKNVIIVVVAPDL